MNCEKWEEPIALLVDGEPTVDGLAEHLESCVACSQLLQDLCADQAMLRTAPEFGTPLQWKRSRRKIQPSWWAAAAIAAGLAFFFAWPSEKGPRSQPPQPAAVALRSPGVKWDRRPGLSRPRTRVAKHTAARKQIKPPFREDWARMLAELWQEPEKKPDLPVTASEMAMRIPTSDPDVVILLVKEERFE